MKRLETTSFSLHILAMLAMLGDHAWATVIPGNDWLNCLGRIAFPIFAFMMVEGYFHTKDLRKMTLRLLIFALISEIPFNLAVGGSIFYPFHQNVMWTFLMAIGAIHLIERSKDSALHMIGAALAAILIALAATITMVDYGGAGVLTVLVFYFFRGNKWWCRLGQAVLLGYINLWMLGGYGYDITIFGLNIWVPRQGFALLALLPIWLYKGKQGYHSKPFQLFYYAFYPLHLLILGLLQ